MSERQFPSAIAGNRQKSENNNFSVFSWVIDQAEYEFLDVWNYFPECEMLER